MHPTVAFILLVLYSYFCKDSTTPAVEKRLGTSTEKHCVHTHDIFHMSDSEMTIEFSVHFWDTE